MRIPTILLAVAGLAVSMQAGATSSTASGAGYSIPDNSPGGASSTATITDDILVTSLTVTLSDLSGTWVGDLIVTLTGPGGQSADLMFRTGDLQGDCCGDSSDLGATYTFADGGADWWAAAAAAGGGDIIPGGTYGATTILGGAVSLNTVFGGKKAIGDWTLAISDNAAGDLHSLGAWSLKIEGTPNVIPIPAAAWLFISAIAGLGALRRKAS